MKNSLLILLLSSLLWNCKKESNFDPVISFIKPEGSILLLAGDTFQVEAHISDDKSLTFISLQLLYMNGTPASSAVLYQPENNSFHINTLYIVNNTALESGHYLITITASDGTNTSRKAREIEIQALPVERLKLLAINATSSTVSVFELDTLQGYSLLTHVNGDYRSSSVSSRYRRLNILGSRSGPFTVLNASNGNLIKEISGLCPIGNQCFEYLHFQDELNFVSYYDGRLKAFDANGLQRFEIAQQGYFRPVSMFRLGDYLIAELLYLNPLNRKIGTFFYPSGVLTLEASVNMDVLSMFRRSPNELYIFGHSNGMAVVDIFNLQLNRTTPLRIFGGMTINDVYQFQTNEFYLATDQGLWNYKVDIGSFTQSTVTPIQSLKFDPVMNELFLIEGKNIKVLDAATSMLKKQYTLPDSVLNLHILYNK